MPCLEIGGASLGLGIWNLEQESLLRDENDSGKRGLERSPEAGWVVGWGRPE